MTIESYATMETEHVKTEHTLVPQIASTRKYSGLIPTVTTLYRKVLV